MDATGFKAISSVDKSRESIGLLAIYKLLTRYFLKSGVGPFLAFFLPLILHVILGFLIKEGNVFGGIATNVGLLIGFLLMPNAVMQLKTTSPMKMLGASPVKPAMFAIAVASYFTILLVIAVAWLCAWSMIIFGGTSKLFGLGSVTGFFSFAVMSLVNGVLCMGVGCLIINFAKTALSAQVYGLLLYFPISFLTGQFMPPAVYLGAEPILWVGRMFPWHYVTLWNMQAVNGDVYVPVFDVATGMFATTNGMPDGPLQYRLLADTNSFRVADYLIPNTQFVRVSEQYVGYNNIYSGLSKLPNTGPADAMKYMSNTFSGLIVDNHPVDSLVFFNKIEHGVAYGYPLVALAITVPAVLRTFRWR